MEYHLRTRRLTGIYCWRRSSCSVFGGLTVHCSLPHGDICQPTPSRLKKFRQTFLSGCHAGLLYKVKRDPASVPFESRILSTSIEAHQNFNNTGCRHVGFWLLTDLTSSSKFARDSVQRIAGSWYAIGLQVSPKY